jgi:Ca-activated chloride channel family protein
LDIQFQYKAFLPLFAVILILSLFYFAWLLWKKQVRKRIGDAGLVNELTEGYSPHSSLLKFAVLMLAFGLGVIALMNPRRPGADESTTRKGIDIAIALDVSKSMLAADLAPNRLERAKQFINKLMASMPDDRIALVLFAGRAYLQMPLTTDHGAAGIFVSAAGPSSVPQQGTVISEALKRASSVFPSRTNTYKSIILISDGEDHDEDAVSAAKDLSEQGVMINTVGIGSPEGTNIIDPLTGEEKKDDAGNPVISKLNEKILIDVAAATNGIYTKL